MNWHATELMAEFLKKYGLEGDEVAKRELEAMVEEILDDEDALRWD